MGATAGTGEGPLFTKAEWPWGSVRESLPVMAVLSPPSEAPIPALTGGLPAGGAVAVTWQRLLAQLLISAA